MMDGLDGWKWLEVGAVASGLCLVLLSPWVLARLTRAQAYRERGAKLHRWMESLRDAPDPWRLAPMLLEQFGPRGQAQAAMAWQERPGREAASDLHALCFAGGPDEERRMGLWKCRLDGRAMGPGTGHQEDAGAWYWPLRGREACFGAITLPLTRMRGDERDAHLAHVQRMADQLGLAMEQHEAWLARTEAAQQAQTQALRNTLLAAVAHDHRTPLATILSAASSLHDHAEDHAPSQRRHLAATIMREAAHLARVTDNMLQLARLDGEGLRLRLDWESAEELLGSVLGRVRARDTGRRIRARVEPGLPLLRVDAVLIAQLLENLLDNALRYAPEGPVELRAHTSPQGQIVLAVRDRGPGVPPAWRERIFERFEQVTGADADSVAASRRGTGLGLALCRAIARAHGGELRLRLRSHGGSSFECHLPAPAQPEGPSMTQEE